MSCTCGHYNYGFSNPTKEEINEYRLYFCDNCRQWISLIGVKK